MINSKQKGNRLERAWAIFLRENNIDKSAKRNDLSGAGTKKSNVIQITALRREIDKMAKNLRKFGLVSISRTGAVAMTRGDKVFN